MDKDFFSGGLATWNKEQMEGQPPEPERGGCSKFSFSGHQQVRPDRDRPSSEYYIRSISDLDCRGNTATGDLVCGGNTPIFCGLVCRGNAVILLLVACVLGQYCYRGSDYCGSTVILRLWLVGQYYNTIGGLVCRGNTTIYVFVAWCVGAILCAYACDGLIVVRRLDSGVDLCSLDYPTALLI